MTSGELRLIDGNGELLCAPEPCSYELVDGRLHISPQVELMCDRNELRMRLWLTTDNGESVELPLSSNVACMGTSVFIGEISDEQSQERLRKSEARQRVRVALDIIDELAPLIIESVLRQYAAGAIQTGELAQLLSRYCDAKSVLATSA